MDNECGTKRCFSEVPKRLKLVRKHLATRPNTPLLNGSAKEIEVALRKYTAVEETDTSSVRIVGERKEKESSSRDYLAIYRMRKGFLIGLPTRDSALSSFLFDLAPPIYKTLTTRSTYLPTPPCLADETFSTSPHRRTTSLVSAACGLAQHNAL